MFWNEVKKISAAGGFLVSIILIAVNMARGYGLYYSAYVSLITLVVSSILFLGCFNTIGKILASYLEAVKKEADLEALRRKKEDAKRKLDELKEKRDSLEGQLNQKFEQLS